MRLHFWAPLALGLTVGLASTSVAQAVRPIELGIDAAISFGLDDPKTTTIGIPAQSVRVGFFVSDNVSIEPSFGLSSIHVSGGGTLTTYTGEVGALWHFAGTPSTHRLYLRPFTGFTGLSGSGLSDTQAELGAGIGIKCRITDHVASRTEANYTHRFESGKSSSGNDIGLRFGLSFFTR